MFSVLAQLILLIFALPAVLWLTIYLGTNLYMKLLGPVNLKKKYNASWALITGAGTGIGKSLAEALAGQGLNLVLVSLSDIYLEETTQQLRQQYAGQEFRSVGVIFDHKHEYMSHIIEATKDIDIQIIVNNAGYMVTGLFDQCSIDSQLANIECNATAAVRITHHFLQRLLEKKLKGCFLYTSSMVGFMPDPIYVMYGATKAFITQFAASLAIEVRNNGIDVVSVQMSPVRTKFYDKTHKLGLLELAKGFSVQLDTVANRMLSCVGRSHVPEVGELAVVGRILTSLFAPYDFLICFFATLFPLSTDYQNMRKPNVHGSHE